ncbi:hypothetical protein DKG75_04200 [Zavarzinia compransoris]|uniref:Uncharacterized protein n=1 Tax=Zavarzinia compransoris TaxID=1264899 RepID=A0A317EAQ7_9PROT|nr:hypothetical protein DKG75_04200 [Zavarzinia compransoris]
MKAGILAILLFIGAQLTWGSILASLVIAAIPAAFIATGIVPAIGYTLGGIALVVTILGAALPATTPLGAAIKTGSFGGISDSMGEASKDLIPSSGNH